MTEPRVELRYATLRVDDGLVYVRVRTGARVTLGDAQDTLASHQTVNGGLGKWPWLVDLRGIVAVEAAARKYFAGAETAKATSALALLLGSPVSRVIGNFMLGINKPIFPTKVFTSEPEALAWLQSFRPEATP